MWDVGKAGVESYAQCHRAQGFSKADNPVLVVEGAGTGQGRNYCCGKRCVSFFLEASAVG